MRRLIHHKRFVVVRYERLVKDPDAVQEELMSRMPFLARRARFSEFYKLALPSKKSLAAMGSLRPIDDSKVGNWRNHLARVAGQLSIYGSICQELVEFGYEQDESWLAQLRGVQPDLTPSHWPDHAAFSVWKIWRRKYAEAAKIAVARVAGVPIV
jgi:hypothetical protein